MPKSNGPDKYFLLPAKPSQADLEKNKIDQVKQQKEIDYQRLLLEELKAKRKDQ